MRTLITITTFAKVVVSERLGSLLSIVEKMAILKILGSKHKPLLLQIQFFVTKVCIIYLKGRDLWTNQIKCFMHQI